MHIHHSCGDLPAQGMLRQYRIHSGKRIVEGSFHEDLPQDLCHQDLAATRGGKNRSPASGSGF